MLADENAFDSPPQAFLADPLLGVVVADRYGIHALLGRGGMGVVYEVEHVRLGKRLALMLLAGELSRDPVVVRRFKHEALTASKLSSPNTVQVFDFGVAEGLTYLVMEVVAGQDLGRVLRAQGPMPFARVGRIVLQWRAVKRFCRPTPDAPPASSTGGSASTWRSDMKVPGPSASWAQPSSAEGSGDSLPRSSARRSSR